MKTRATTPSRPRRRKRSRQRISVRRSPDGSVYRLAFVEMLARYRAAAGQPRLGTDRVKQMSDEALYRAVRAARRAADGADAQRGSSLPEEIGDQPETARSRPR